MNKAARIALCAMGIFLTFLFILAGVIASLESLE